jgi:thiamine biosynthesis lipoprotein
VPEAQPVARRVRVEQVMGTAIGVDLREPWVTDEAIDRLFAWLREVDARFSTYRQTSEIRRLDRGELALDAAHADVREVLELCDEVERRSDGHFSARPAGGGLDPSAVVKGWSVDRGARLLEAAGARNFCINAGGDVLARGEPEPGRPWRVGIRHPEEAGLMLAVLGVRDLAVATSGTYERGGHIVDPATGGPARDLLSMTVVGPSLTLADAHSTAAFAMGLEGARWVAGIPDHGACAVTAGRRVVWTNGCRRLRVQDTAR